MRSFGDEIAVLDGIEVEDGRIGRTPATGAEYAKRISTGLEIRRNVLDPSEGANYSGGSNAVPRLIPLMPSSVGLAEDLADKDLLNYMRTSSVLPTRRNVISPSQGGNYSGGSSAMPSDIPLMPSSVGLAGCEGACYQGVPLGAWDRAFGSTLEIQDGRIGRVPATGEEYARRLAPGLEIRRNVIDPSEGQNYSGGSSAVPEYIPLMPSSIGLAGLDDLPDAVFEAVPADILSSAVGSMFRLKRGAFESLAGHRRLRRLKGKKAKMIRTIPRMHPSQKRVATQKISALDRAIKKIRLYRAKALVGKRMGRQSMAEALVRQVTGGRRVPMAKVAKVLKAKARRMPDPQSFMKQVAAAAARAA
jgi:hypothetical protein